MRRKLRGLLRNRCGASFPLAIAVTLSLVFLFCLISEYFRLQIIAAGVRDAVEDAIISTVNDNYAGVYHGVREGYSGGYLPFGDGDFEETLDEGDIEGILIDTLGVRRNSGRLVKYAGDEGTAMEYAIDSIDITIRNAPLAPADPKNAQRFEAETSVQLEVPVRFGGKVLPSMKIHLKVQAGYTEVF